jgi:hypothetical protein
MVNRYILASPQIHNTIILVFADSSHPFNLFRQNIVRKFSEMKQTKWLGEARRIIQSEKWEIFYFQEKEMPLKYCRFYQKNEDWKAGHAACAKDSVSIAIRNAIKRTSLTVSHRYLFLDNDDDDNDFGENVINSPNEKGSGNYLSSDASLKTKVSSILSSSLSQVVSQTLNEISRTLSLGDPSMGDAARKRIDKSMLLGLFELEKKEIQIPDGSEEDPLVGWPEGAIGAITSKTIEFVKLMEEIVSVCHQIEGDVDM